MTRFALFPTALGTCAIAWKAAGIAGVQLPDADEGSGRLRRRFADAEESAPPARVRDVIARIVAHLAGTKTDYGDVTLDNGAIGAFERRVYDAAAAIGWGETTTYGAIAAALGDITLSRAVGQALGRNPWPIVIPCHRVTAADGRTGGFSAPGGRATKLRLLEIEGALAPEGLPLFAGGF
jgi:methylated-DNA-[protein]-cysteine S-methyltransferase